VYQHRIIRCGTVITVSLSRVKQVSSGRRRICADGKKFSVLTRRISTSSRFVDQRRGRGGGGRRVAVNAANRDGRVQIAGTPPRGWSSVGRRPSARQCPLTERAGIVDRLRVRSALKQFYQAAHTRYSCTPAGLMCMFTYLLVANAVSG